MTALIYKGRALDAVTAETVLDCLHRHEIPVASACRSGICQSCLVQGASQPPAAAQKGLRSALVQRQFFLACQCPVADSPEIIEQEELPSLPSRVVAVHELAPDVFQVLIERPPDFDFESGQFVNLVRPMDGLVRSYSIASLPGAELIELHVARLPKGKMSNYLTREIGVPLFLRGPAGECVYRPELQEPLVLVGTGTGLAPLVGILQAALKAGHQGQIHLFHGALRPRGLYLRDLLRQLSEEHANVHYLESVLEPELSAAAQTGPQLEQEGGQSQEDRVLDLPTLVAQRFPELGGHRVYLCGNPELVQRLKRQCYLRGAALSAIHSDPFLLAPN